jgi:hypothetical protein
LPRDAENELHVGVLGRGPALQGIEPAVDGLDPETAFAVGNGERLIRTLSTLSRTGLPIDDTPENRVVVATP